MYGRGPGPYTGTQVVGTVGPVCVDQAGYLFRLPGHQRAIASVLENAPHVRQCLLLAEGKTVREIASSTGRRVSTIRWHVRQIFTKHGLTRQGDLVQLVLSVAGDEQCGPQQDPAPPGGAPHARP